MSTSPTPPLDPFLEELLADMDRLGSRPYAEIGVPMFLVAENLTDEPSAPTGVNQLSGAELAEMFSRAAEALKAHRPELTPTDVARLVEVIADRHFLGLETPAFSTIGELHTKGA